VSAVAEEIRLYTVKEAARVMQISRSKLYELIQQRHVAAVRPGGRIRIEWAEIVRYIRSTKLR